MTFSEGRRHVVLAHSPRDRLHAMSIAMQLSVLKLGSAEMQNELLRNLWPRDAQGRRHLDCYWLLPVNSELQSHSMT